MKDYRDWPKRSALQVLKGFHKPAMEAAPSSEFREAPMLKARCVRLKNRSHVIGKTVFNFDADGICAIPDAGNNRYDYERLLQMNGVTPVVDAPPSASESALASKPTITQAPAPAPAPASAVPAPAPAPAPPVDDDKAEAETKRETKVSVEAPAEDKPRPRRRAAVKKKK